jgi:hypothetical protein
MSLYYFVGGPVDGKSEEFFRRLAEIGGSPSGWRIYPHAADDGKALHIAEVKTREEILVHLRHFEDIYEHTPITAIVER